MILGDFNLGRLNNSREIVFKIFKYHKHILRNISLIFRSNNLLQLHNIRMMQRLENLHFTNCSNGKPILLLFCINSLESDNFTSDFVGSYKHAPISPLSNLMFLLKRSNISHDNWCFERDSTVLLFLTLTLSCVCVWSSSGTSCCCVVECGYFWSSPLFDNWFCSSSNWWSRGWGWLLHHRNPPIIRVGSWWWRGRTIRRRWWWYTISLFHPWRWRRWLHSSSPIIIR
mmetsp:Transcript_32162/g.48207  ORF Transcript_32162/g.48207 Transcript_32162/m.48207 type:complete len:228 (+) Transcript_32162:1066-1749(+)